MVRVVPDLRFILWGAFAWLSKHFEQHLVFEDESQDIVYLIVESTWAQVELVPALQAKLKPRSYPTMRRGRFWAT